MGPPSGCLVLVCGHPSSGKSLTAADLSRRLTQKGANVKLVDEPLLHLPRNASYQDARSEKNTRGLLKATVERAIHKDGPVVILDANNGIKGYRYELWCIARQAEVRFCVVYCNTDAGKAKAWNTERRKDLSAAAEGCFEETNQSFANQTASTRTEWGGYDDNIFADLVFRFEQPDGRNRWDSPLFVVTPEEVSNTETVDTNEGKNNSEKKNEIDRDASYGFPKRQSLDGYDDLPPTRSETLDSCVYSILGIPDPSQKANNSNRNGKTSSGILRAIAKSASTQPTTRPSDASLRADVDAGAQDIIDAIVRFDSEAGGGGLYGGIATYEFGQGVAPLRSRSTPSLQILRKLKRTFLKTAGAAVGSGDAASVRAAARRLFVEHVQRDANLNNW